MTSTFQADSKVLQALQPLLPVIAADSDGIEERVGMSKPVLKGLVDSGLYNMLTPPSRGGQGLNLLQVVRVIESLARVDGSAGWTAMVASGFQFLIGLFPDETISEMLANGPDVRMRGALAPKGRFIPENGGYRASGQWPLASGSFAYDWVIAGGLVFEGDKPRMGPNGPEFLVMLVPASDATFLDTWNSVGLRGSASHDFVLKDVWVPPHRAVSIMRPSTFKEPIFQLPFPMLTAGQHTAVNTGIALGALDDLKALAATKRPAWKPNEKLVDDPVFRAEVGKLEARLDAARAYADWHAVDTWELAHSGRPAAPENLARTQAMVTHVQLACMDIVNDAFTLAGSTAAYRGHTLQRRWRDIRVASQHTAGSLDHYKSLGAAVLDTAATTPSHWRTPQSPPAAAPAREAAATPA